MKFTVLTLGCKANQAESNSIAQALTGKSMCQAPLSDKPDLCIVNTCTVTSKSDYQSRQLIRRALKTGAQVYVTGCYSELNDREIQSISKEINIVKNNVKVNYFNSLDANSCSSDLSSDTKRSRALIKIQEGCNAICSYCIIPKVRGMPVSRELKDIVEELKEWENAGYNEAVLTGIHIGLYGIDFSSGVTISKLVESILANTDKIRIRLSSLEINEINDHIISLLKDQRVCTHLHIPLQSGDNDILTMMKRRYSVTDFGNILNTITDTIENISIGSDIIVGFPGETEKRFMNSYNFIEENLFTYLHVFPYSKRKNTEAYNYNGHVNEEIKKKRAFLLRELSNRKKETFLSRQRGRELPSIIEKRIDQGCLATTDNYLKIKISSTELQPKSLVNIRVTGHHDGMLTGNPITTL